MCALKNEFLCAARNRQQPAGHGITCEALTVPLSSDRRKARMRHRISPLQQDFRASNTHSLLTDMINRNRNGEMCLSECIYSSINDQSEVSPRNICGRGQHVRNYHWTSLASVIKLTGSEQYSSFLQVMRKTIFDRHVL